MTNAQQGIDIITIYKAIDYDLNIHLDETKLNSVLSIMSGDCEEYEALSELKTIMDLNSEYKSYICMGYYNLRNIIEKSSWYILYTPYQAEIAENCLFNFQTEIANALLDECV